jgi:hypothetical protein
MIEKHTGQTQLRRSLDRSHQRKPLRLGISRRVARTLTGREVFVTQVRFGKKRAVLVPWHDEHHPVQP